MVLLTIARPFANHNGGITEFGPDGFLYIGMGDGGSANDPGMLAQNINELLGKILRIDINTGPCLTPPLRPIPSSARLPGAMRSTQSECGIPGASLSIAEQDNSTWGTSARGLARR